MHLIRLPVSQLAKFSLLALLACLLIACNSNPSSDPELASPELQVPPADSGAPGDDITQERCSPGITSDDAQSAASSECENATVRALWIWGSREVFDRAYESQLFELNFNRIYLAAIQALQHDQTALAEFFRRAHHRGIAVELLFGQPDWALAENHHQVLSIIDQVGNFARRFPDIQVAGIHLDVEPYLLPQWDTDRQSLASAYIDLLESARERSSQSGLPLFADIPVWYDEHAIFRGGRARMLHELAIDATDGISLMDYRDHSEPIVNDASIELGYALTQNKGVTIGVETLCIEPTWITFCEEGRSVMEQTLKSVNHTLQDHAAYRGYAIHHLDSYLELAP